MSICCHECGTNLAPSEAFPGMEGGVIYPNVLAVVWTPDEAWVTAFVQAPQHVACCFACIAKHLEDAATLQPVYEAYEAEIVYRRFQIKNKDKGLMPLEDFGAQLAQSGALLDALSEKHKLIPDKSCLMCATGIPDQQQAYFSFKVTDKAYCEQNLVPFFGAYQMSDYKVGMTNFRICFGCVKQYLPRIFKQLSYDLRGTGENNFSEVTDTRIHLSPEVLRELYGFESN